MVTECLPRHGKRLWFADGPHVDDGARGDDAFERGNWRVTAASVLHPLRPLCRLLFAAACPVGGG